MEPLLEPVGKPVKKTKISSVKRMKIKLFDGWAKWYGDLYKKEDVKAIKRVEDLQSIHRLRIFSGYIPDTQKYRVIDVGCGTGNYTVELARLGLEMTGVDPSLVMLAKAQSKSDEIRWVCASSDSLPWLK